MDQTIIDKLNRCLLKGRPILFTGAGFSRYGKNGQGRYVPTGAELKSMILTELLGFEKDVDDYNDLIKNSLTDIYGFALEEKSEQKVRDFVFSLFTDCTPQNFHCVIARFNWKRIYTTNIDDLYENASKHDSLLVQNMPTRRESFSGKKTEYVKLHGCVRNPSGGIVFSRQDYIDSMLKSKDYRFNMFGQDIQTEDFIFIGTEMDEFNLDYYLKLFESVQGQSTNGQLFFIKPKPDRMFLSKINKRGGYVIDWTAEKFAEHLQKIAVKEKANPYLYRIDGYQYINKLFELAKGFKGFRSDLYLGNDPIWNDVFFDWDFLQPQMDVLSKQVTDYTDKGHSLVVSLCGKAMSGKSVYLKRLGIRLINEGFAVYEFVGRRFNYYDFVRTCRIIPDTKIALLIDDGSFYYSAIRNLMRDFEKSKCLVVVTTSRPYYHNRKRYNLVFETQLLEENIQTEIVSSDNQFAKNIANKLDEKGFLGKLKSLDNNERIAYISKTNDVSSLLYSLNHGSSNAFQRRQKEVYAEMKDEIGNYNRFLQLLAIFQKMDLPYFPLELLGLWDAKNYSQILEKCQDFIKFAPDSHGVELRNDILTNLLLKDLDSSEKMELIGEILVLVSPQVSDKDHSYWNEIQSSLMKGKLLKRVLGIKRDDIKSLLFSIQKYYNDNFNYWIQVGISEQNERDFEKALNHFNQAASINPRSYMVLNAIARNYMLQANSKHTRAEAQPLFEEGERRILDLIREREEFQVKAFSTHGYLFEKLRYLEKFEKHPNVDELKKMYGMLKSIIDRDHSDPMAKHISNLFLKYIKKQGLSKKLQFTFYDLAYLKTMLNENDRDIKSFLEDFELD